VGGWGRGEGRKKKSGENYYIFHVQKGFAGYIFILAWKWHENNVKMV